MNYERVQQQTWVVFGALAMSFALLLVILAPMRAHAESSLAGTHIVNSNVFYAYLEAGESLEATITKIHNGASTANATWHALGPGGVNQTCTVTGAAAAAPDPASTCGWSGGTALTATQPGIWAILFTHTGDSDVFDWDVAVNDGAPIPGRVWMERYVIYQDPNPPINDPAGVNMQLWFQSQWGYQYDVTFLDYNGLGSVVQASSLGLVQPGTCLPVYQSFNESDRNTLWDYPAADCHSQYKMFFEPPASDLPASATRWDSATDWVLPPIADPQITNLTFTPSTTGARDGTISFDPLDYKGPINIQVDTNNNGVYTDPEDVTIPVSAQADPMDVPFDGLDGNNNPIPSSQAITFRAAIDKVAEIHFIEDDVERRDGGIQVQRLNGPSGDESLIYWDDTDLPSPDATRCSFTSVRDGTAGVDSATGVHSWTNDTPPCPDLGNQVGFDSWGDRRVINDWAFVPIDIFATYALAAHVPPSPPVPSTGGGSASNETLANTGTSQVGLFALAMTLIAIPALALIGLRKSSLFL